MCTREQPHLDNAHVVFGQLIAGFSTLRVIEELGDRRGSLSLRAEIQNCGEFREPTECAQEPSCKGSTASPVTREAQGESLTRRKPTVAEES